MFLWAYASTKKRIWLLEKKKLFNTHNVNVWNVIDNNGMK